MKTFTAISLLRDEQPVRIGKPLASLLVCFVLFGRVCYGDGLRSIALKNSRTVENDREFWEE